MVHQLAPLFSSLVQKTTLIIMNYNVGKKKRLIPLQLNGASESSVLEQQT